MSVSACVTYCCVSGSSKGSVDAAGAAGSWAALGATNSAGLLGVSALPDGADLLGGSAGLLLASGAASFSGFYSSRSS